MLSHWRTSYDVEDTIPESHRIPPQKMRLVFTFAGFVRSFTSTARHPRCNPIRFVILVLFYPLQKGSHLPDLLRERRPVVHCKHHRRVVSCSFVLSIVVDLPSQHGMCVCHRSNRNEAFCFRLSLYVEIVFVQLPPLTTVHSGRFRWLRARPPTKIRRSFISCSLTSWHIYLRVADIVHRNMIRPSFFLRFFFAFHLFFKLP